MSVRSVENSRIVIVGAGNLATCLGVALQKAGIVPQAVWSRTETSAVALAERLGCKATTDIASLPDADIVITAVSDDALPLVAKLLAARYKEALLVHTAGSVSMNIWADAGAVRYGVFYPMQTFSKAKEVDFSRLGIFIESNSEADCFLLEKFSSKLTNKVYRATSAQRAYLHIAAVFACNFSNAMYAMAADLLREQGLPFEVMLPLIDETAAKLHFLSPLEAQTGPARRGDKQVMASHRSKLSGEYAEIYDIISKYISDKAVVK